MSYEGCCRVLLLYFVEFSLLVIYGYIWWGVFELVKLLLLWIVIKIDKLYRRKVRSYKFGVLKVIIVSNL